MSSPLAKRLFAIDGVSGVFFGSDFVTVTKSDEYVWSMLKPEVFAAIMEHFTSGMPSVVGSILLGFVMLTGQPLLVASSVAWRCVAVKPSAQSSQES